uniref:Uncharacterized protein n=1 Tax=Romanomermis culicivorax TaxID=13658 RepID=A0A915HQF1_ROMCU
SIVLVVSLIVWLIGALLILAVLFTCTIVTCRGCCCFITALALKEGITYLLMRHFIAAALVPLGCLLTWIGYALFHCAWGAHLLDEEEVKMKVYRDPEQQQRVYEQPPFALPPTQPLELHDGSPFRVNVEEVVIPDHNPRDAGYWKFVGDDAWQNKCSRDTLQ